MDLDSGIIRKIQALGRPTMEEFLECRNVRIAARTDPATEVAGDFFDVMARPDGSTLIGIGDVTGHGLASGIITLLARNVFRSTFADSDLSITDGLMKINAALFESLQHDMRDENNLTLILMKCSENEICVTGTHENIILSRPGKKFEIIDTTKLGMYIGLEANISDYVTEQKIPFQEGDILLLYTDGATDIENEKGEYFGLERLLISFGEHKNLPVEGIVDAMMDDIYRWTEGRPAPDDITLMAVAKA